MLGLLRHAAVAAIALALAAPTVCAQSRPLAVDDIISLEAFGRAALSPDGRWAVYEKEGAYDTAPSFDYGNRSTWAGSDLWLVDLSGSGARPERLLPGEGPGLLRAEWSPDSDRLVVWKFRDDRLEVGVVDVARRSVAWTGLTPEIPLAGADTVWVSDDEVALTVRPDGSLPAILRYYGGSQTRTREAWERTRLGREASRTVIEAHGGVATAETAKTSQALVLLNVRTGVRRVVAEGRIADISVSPDGARIAVLRSEEAVPVEPDDLLQAQGPYRLRLRLIDRASGGEVQPDDRLDIGPHLLRWSPDSRALLVWARRDDQPWEQGGLFRIAAEGAGRVPMTGLSVGAGAEILRGVRADWSGPTPIVRARAGSQGRWDWYALPDEGPPVPLTSTLMAAPAQIAAVDGSALLMFGNGGLWSVSPEGTRQLTGGTEQLRLWTAPDPDLMMRLKVNTAPHRNWAVGQTESGRPAIVTATGGVRPMEGGDPVRTLAAGRDAALVLRRTGLSETLSLVGDGRTVDLDRVNEGLDEVILTEPIAVEHLDAFGRPTTSWLFLPAGGASAARGLIVETYPGAVDSGAWYGPGRLVYAFRAVVAAGAGFAVLTPSIPVDRPDAVGAAYYEASVDLAVDAALAAHSDLPDDRMAGSSASAQ